MLSAFITRHTSQAGILLYQNIFKAFALLYALYQITSTYNVFVEKILKI